MKPETFAETADIETSSDEYARRFTGPVGAWFLRVQSAATLELLGKYPGATVLDVGGGHGQTAGLLAGAGYRVTVLGSAPACGERIRPLVESGQVVFRVGDLLELPFSERAFDIVLSYRLLPHVTRWREFLGELARVSKGVILLDYPEVKSINSIAPALFPFKQRLEGNTRPYTCFREPELLETFRPLGFSPAGRYPQFFLPMVLHRKLKLPALSAGAETVFRTLGLTERFGSPVIMKWVRGQTRRDTKVHNEHPHAGSTTVL